MNATNVAKSFPLCRVATIVRRCVVSLQILCRVPEFVSQFLFITRADIIPLIPVIFLSQYVSCYIDKGSKYTP
jgi:hypothetical protein